MRDTSDRKKELDERRLDKSDRALYETTWRDKEVRKQLDAVGSKVKDNPRFGRLPKDELHRLERIRDESPMRHLNDFDPQKELASQKREISTNPEGYLRRHAGESLDSATLRESYDAVEKRRARG